VVEFNIVNIVGGITYEQELELSALAETFEQRDEINSVTYEPSKNHWLQACFAPNNAYVPFYRSGKCSVVGNSSFEQFWETVDQVNIIMRELLEFEYEPKVEVTNVVATAELDSFPSLEVLAVELGLERTEYEPEQFPALIYRKERAVILLFANGKLICTGLTSVNHISSSIDRVCTQIDKIKSN
jgi:transcription initiation factor TFIID TATA-box-binding protein